MKKILVLINISFFMISLLTFQPAYAKDKKGVLLVTTDKLAENYEIIGIVYARISTPNISDLNEELEKRADKMKADAVISIRYLPYLGYLYAYGTAVKFEK